MQIETRAEKPFGHYITLSIIMKQDSDNSRRDFIKTGLLAAGSFLIVPRHVLGRGYTAPSDKLNLAAIGAGGKGSSDIFNAYNNGAHNVVALCDVDFGQAAKTVTSVKCLKKWGRR